MTDKIYVFDAEFNSLTPDIIHVLTYAFKDTNSNAWRTVSITDHDRMRKFLTQENATFIGHNIIQFDIPALEKILNIKVPKSNRFIDTLSLSWYLYPDMKKHSLSTHGAFLGMQKIDIDNWENLPLNDYIRRCERDVTINILMYENMMADFKELYNEKPFHHVIQRLSFKMKCLAMQAKNPFKLDLEFIYDILPKLKSNLDEMHYELKQVMPKVPEYASIKRPSVMYLKNGNLSNPAGKFLNLYFKDNIPITEMHRDTAKYSNNYPEEIKYIKKYKDPNPDSDIQLKSWLKSLGWIPCTYRMELKGDTKHFIELILTKDKALTPSVQSLVSKYPQVQLLEHTGILSDRIATIQRFVDKAIRSSNPKHNSIERDHIISTAGGFTNTLRIKHTVVANLPKVRAAYGQYIRRSLIPDDNMELCEADIKSLENTARNHFIFHYDRPYVDTMSSPDYDSHLDLAVSAGIMTEHEVAFYKWYKNK